MPEKTGAAASQDALTDEHTILFRHAAAGPAPPSGRDNQGDGIGHVVSPVEELRHFVQFHWYCQAFALSRRVRWYSARAMSSSTVLSLSALFALVPAAVAAWRGIGNRSPLFWLFTVVAGVGPLALIAVRFGGVWSTGLAETLWVTVFASILLFAVVTGLSREGWRLAPLLFPYLILLGLIATIWEQAPRGPMPEALRDGWILFHVVIAVATYGLLTLAAIAGLAVLLREHGMRAKRRSALSDLLPSVADAERLQVGLLAASEIVLGLGLVTGMGLQLLSTGDLLAFDHKTLLTFGGFAVIAGLLFAHYRTGLRGRRVARLLLVAYLLVTLGFPGVKFVQDVVLV